MKLLNARITHRKASIPILDAVTFREEERALHDLASIPGVREVILTQTCNRVEIWAALDDESWKESSQTVLDYWRKKAKLREESFRRVIEVEYDRDAIRHLFRVASGVESMLIGEEQILGQVRRAYQKAAQLKAAGRYLGAVFSKAIRVGRKARVITGISKGAVSIGSAAVRLMERHLGNLQRRRVIIVGAGETGELVGKALAARKGAAIFVANRTYERGLRLASLLDGRAVRFDRIPDFLATVDVAVVTTAAPHYVITRDLAEAATKDRRDPLLIIDLSQPANVDPAVMSVPRVKLLNLDDLRGVAELNLKARAREVKKVEEFVERELGEFASYLRRLEVEPLIAAICRSAENLRVQELEKLRSILELDEDRWLIVERFSQELVETILRAPLNAIRRAAIHEDSAIVSVAHEIFGIEEDVPSGKA